MRRDLCLKKKDIFLKINEKTVFDYDFGLYLKIAEPYFYIKLTKSIGYFPQFQPIFKDIVSISESLVFVSTRFLSTQDSLLIYDVLSFYIEAQKNDAIVISENVTVSMQYFTASQDAVTITESVTLTLTSGSNLVNGSAINGAII